MREDRVVHGRPGGTRFVGRVAELAVIDAALAQLRSCRSAGVLVAGEAGIGKSRLVEELCRQARSMGALVVTGRTAPGGDALPYGTVVSLMRDLGTSLGGDDAVGVVDVHRRLLVAEPGPENQGRLARLVLFEEVLAVVGRLAADRPVVLVAEDLHWADAGSYGMVDHLLRNLAEAPILVVATYRPSDVDVAAPTRQALTELRNLRTMTTIEPEGLDRDDIALLRPTCWATHRPGRWSTPSTDVPRAPALRRGARRGDRRQRPAAGACRPAVRTDRGARSRGSQGCRRGGDDRGAGRPRAARGRPRVLGDGARGCPR